MFSTSSKLKHKNSTWSLVAKGTSMSHDEYLRSYFTALEAAKPTPSWGLSHAISYEDGSVYALVGIGDARAQIRIQELDPDPIRMANAVIEQLRSIPMDSQVFDGG
jgi:hypothetical protein